MDDTPTIMDVMSDDEKSDDLLSVLAAKQKAVADSRQTDLLVPGYDEEPPLLYIRYRLMDGPEIDRMTDKVMRETRSRWERNINAALDTFINACIGIYVDVEGKGKEHLKPLTYHGTPITGFTRDLAEALQYANTLDDPDSHRQVAMGLFGNNDVAIAQHNFRLNRWMGNTSVDVNAEFLGGNL